jgi:predicted DNA-binding protein YlxM (UPF0122 family)
MDPLTRRLLLFDFYGGLLTERQREVYDLYYQKDFSLGEIAEMLHVSRAAVHDLLRRTEEGLERYEGILSLLALYVRRKEALEAFLSRLREAEAVPAPWRREFESRIERLLRMDQEA